MDLKTTFNIFQASSLGHGFLYYDLRVPLALFGSQGSYKDYGTQWIWDNLHWTGEDCLEVTDIAMFWKQNSFLPSSQKSRKPKLVYPFFVISVLRMHHYPRCHACSLSCQHFKVCRTNINGYLEGYVEGIPGLGPV